MSILQAILNKIDNWRNSKLLRQPGDLGKFWRNGGNNLLFENLPVSTNGIVIDAGAFKGEWTNGIITRYGCKIIMFEPVPSLFFPLHSFYKKNSNVNVINAALGSKNLFLPISINNDSSSLFKKFNDQNTIDIQVLDISKFIFDNNIKELSCLKLNIEGGEYEVLERLIETDLIKICKSILVQFHKQPDDYLSRMIKIEKSLSKTHKLVWKYSFVWELWILK